MSYIANSSKTLLPHLPHVLERPRLMERLRDSEDKRLVLILGQAAQGKSTLAATYLRQSTIPTAWINLDDKDSDPVNLFHVLVQSLQNAIIEIDSHDLSHYPALSFAPRESPSLYREWVQVLMEHITAPVRVVFDGLDRLSADALSHRFLQALVDHSPQNVHFVLLTREMPPLDLNARRMRQEICIISNEDLAFTQDEIQDFFREIHHVSFAFDDVQKIRRATEGWVGGLILLVESMACRTGQSEGMTVLQELPDRFSKKVFHYFGEEIFSYQAAHYRDFLVKSSILDSVEPSFAKEITGTADAHEILQTLAERNLFIHSIYTKKGGWLFRYHQLFRDFLQAKFNEEMDEETKRALFMKAASLSERRGDWESAVKFYLKTEAFPEAASLMERIGSDLLKAGRAGDLSQWLAQLPDDLVQSRPWLLLYLSMTKPFTGENNHRSRLQNALALFEAREDMSGCILSLAYLIEASMIGGNDSIPLIFLLARGERLLQSMSSGLHAYERAVLWSKMGLAYSLRGGDPRKGYWASQNAYLIAQSLEDLFIQARSLSQMLESLTLLGEYSQARQAHETLRRIVAKCPLPELRVLYPMHSSLLLAFTGEFKEAEVMLLDARAEMKKSGLVYLYPISLLYEFFVKLHLGEFDHARQIANHLLNLSISTDNYVLKGLSMFLLGQGYYVTGDFEKAEKLLSASGSILSTREASSEFHFHSGKVLMCLISIHIDEHDETERELLQAMDYYHRIACHILLVDAHLAMALLNWKRGKPDGVILHLNAGFGIAEQKGYDHFLLINREDLAKACTLALELQAPGGMKYAERLLSTKLADVAGPHLEPLARCAKPHIAAKAGKIRKVIHRSTVPLLRIETLGGFRLFRGEEPIDEDQWQAQQPGRLMKAIISLGPSGVPKDLLLEALWPEVPPESSERSFKVVLHRLRKVLEPALNNEFGSSYIHLGSNLVSLDEELSLVDVDELHSLCDQGITRERAGDVKAALTFYRRASDVYRGDFLPDDLARPWAGIKRDALRSEYLELLLRQAALIERHKGGMRQPIALYRKIIEIDPLKEQAYQGLMALYGNRGISDQVIKVYEECKKAIKDGLNAKPDALTESLFRKVLECPTSM